MSGAWLCLCLMEGADYPITATLLGGQCCGQHVLTQPTCCASVTWCLYCCFLCTQLGWGLATLPQSPLIVSKALPGERACACTCHAAFCHCFGACPLICQPSTPLLCPECALQLTPLPNVTLYYAAYRFFSHLQASVGVKLEGCKAGGWSNGCGGLGLGVGVGLRVEHGCRAWVLSLECGG